MSLKLIKLEPKIAKATLVVVAVACVVTAFFFIRWSFSNAIASRLDLKRPESKLVIDWLIGLGPSDPQTHYAAAELFERTFDANDLSRSLNEYEIAASLTPNNYLMWISLGRARSLSGDDAGANAALKRAIELAPNYAAVQWTYGNLLIRQGETTDGFKLTARAAQSNPEYALGSVVTAMQILEGDIAAVRNALGDSEAINAALVSTLMGSQRFEDAVDSWSKLPDEIKSGAQKKLSEKLAEQLIAGKKFRLASRVLGVISPEGSNKPVAERITNGGFEPGIKLRGAGPFEWQIADGAEPQIGQNTVQKRSGEFGLLFLFNSFETATFRSLSQTIAVDPGSQYEFEGFYRSDLKTSASIKIEVADAATNAVIVSTPPLALAGDWTTIRLKFTAPTGSDGIIIRLVRDGCVGPTCRMTGSLSFDDFSLKPL